MEISLNWLKQYCQISLPSEEIEKGLTLLGIECTHDSQSLSFTDVVLGRVIDCNPHPESEHLSVCVVDVGDEENYQIVCGAPNVKKDILVPVAKVGGTLSDGDFKIKKAKLRGVESKGMICSGKELRLNGDHEGILILDTQLPLGTSIEKVIDFNCDTIFHLDITPNRGDCFSHQGVAREVAILESVPIQQKQLSVVESGLGISEQMKIDILALDGCPRYTARIINGVKIGPSPEWLVKKLTSIGQKSINNVVDAANYVLMDMGHPMHTFDLDKLSSKHINIRFARENEKMVLLDEKERELSTDHLLICDGDLPVALAGIMGGLQSGITEDTTNILIESAYFDPIVIRKGAKKLDLSTDASKRFERDTDIENVIPAMDYLSQLIVELAGGHISQGIIDIYPDRKLQTKISLNLDKCNNLLGISLTPDALIQILDKLSISHEKDGVNLICLIPTYRNDLIREVDLIEEVARVFGYDNIPESKSFSGSYLSFIPDLHNLDGKIRQILSNNGFSEHYSNSLLLEKLNHHFSDKPGISLLNPLSNEMSVLRNSILPGLLSAVAYNEKRQVKGFKLFEIGAIHEMNQESIRLSDEHFYLGMVWHAHSVLHWRKLPDPDLFQIKGEILKTLRMIGLNDISFQSDEVIGLSKSASIFSRDTQIGNFGELSPIRKKEYDIAGQVFVFQANVDILTKLIAKNKLQYEPPSLFPAVTRDIAILVEKNILSEDVIKSIFSLGGNLLKEVTLFDYYEDPSFGSTKKSLAYSLKFQSSDKTLKDKIVDKLITKILQQLKQQFDAIQR